MSPIAPARDRVKLMLSHIPLGTLLYIHDSTDPKSNPITGTFAGIGLSDGEDLVNVDTQNGKAGVRLDDVVAITVFIN